MKKNMISRIISEANYITDNKKTVRETAKVFNVSKSTVHKDMKERLIKIDLNLYKEVQKVFKYHILIRHINGGEATKQKYLKIKGI